MSTSSWIALTLGRLRGEQSIPEPLSPGLNSNGNFFAARHTEIGGQCGWAITIGDEVTLAQHVRVIAPRYGREAPLGLHARPPSEQRRPAYVGAGAIILPGVTSERRPSVIRVHALSSWAVSWLALRARGMTNRRPAACSSAGPARVMTLESKTSSSCGWPVACGSPDAEKRNQGGR